MTKHKNNGLRYIAYVRKSEERKERQELSHPAQIRKIKEQFSDLNIIRWMDAESKSAFKTGRPIFKEMMDMIDAGEADGIVAYYPNRLSRNEIDTGRLTYALRDSLKDLKFCTYNFDNTPEGIMMLQMIMNQGQYESSKQGRDVKRGMEEKALGGERPGQVPLGYIKVPVLDENGRLIKFKKDKIRTKTDCDPERFDQVKKMWKMLIYENYTPSQICKIANEQWGFKTRPIQRRGTDYQISQSLGASSIYRIFANPFYAGWILHNRELHRGNHKRMITLKEYNYAQKLLGKHGKPRVGAKNDHPYGSMIVCGECGCKIVTKMTTKLIKRTGKIKTYIHYYCTRKSINRPCEQRKYTTIEDLEQEIDQELARFTIIPEFRDMALSILRKEHKLEVADRSTVYKQQQRQRNYIQEQLDELVDMRTRHLLNDDEYTTQRNRLKLQLAGMDEDLRGTESRADKWLQLTEEVFDFATYARIWLRESKDPMVKRKILLGLGENFVLKDNKLTLTPHEWLLPIESDYPELLREYDQVRTDKSLTDKMRESAEALIFERWRAIRD